MIERMPLNLGNYEADWSNEPAVREDRREPDSFDDEERAAEQAKAFAELVERAHAHLSSDSVRKPGDRTVGRRAAARLRLSLPARFTAVERTHECILLNLSRTGAQIAILDSVRFGDSGILHCGKLSAFATVARSEFGLNALHFEEELSQDEVLDIRRYYENFEERERRQLVEDRRAHV